MARVALMVDVEQLVEGIASLVVSLPPEVVRGLAAGMVQGVERIEEKRAQAAANPAPKPPKPAKKRRS